MIKNHYETTERYCVIATEDYEEIMIHCIERVQESPSWALPGFFKKNLKIFVEEVYQRGDTPPAWLYIKRAQQLFTGHFQLSLNDGKEFMLDFDEGTLPVTGEYKNGYTGANDWVTAFYLAIILRDVKAIGILSQVTEEIFKAE